MILSEKSQFYFLGRRNSGRFQLERERMIRKDLLLIGNISSIIYLFRLIEKHYTMSFYNVLYLITSYSINLSLCLVEVMIDFLLFFHVGTSNSLSISFQTQLISFTFTLISYINVCHCFESLTACLFSFLFKMALIRWIPFWMHEMKQILFPPSSPDCFLQVYTCFFLRCNSKPPVHLVSYYFSGIGKQDMKIWIKD